MPCSLPFSRAAAPQQPPTRASGVLARLETPRHAFCAGALAGFASVGLVLLALGPTTGAAASHGSRFAALGFGHLPPARGASLDGSFGQPPSAFVRAKAARHAASLHMGAEQEEPGAAASTQPQPADPAVPEKRPPSLARDPDVVQRTRRRYQVDKAMGRGKETQARMAQHRAVQDKAQLKNEEREATTAQAFTTLKELLNATSAQIKVAAAAVETQQGGIYVDQHIKATNIARTDLGRALTLLEDSVHVVEEAQARLESMRKNPFTDGQKSAEGDLMVKQLLAKKAIEDAFKEHGDRNFTPV